MYHAPSACSSINEDKACLEAFGGALWGLAESEWGEGREGKNEKRSGKGCGHNKGGKLEGFVFLKGGGLLL